jgi:hypothetical protein
VPAAACVVLAACALLAPGGAGAQTARRDAAGPASRTAARIALLREAIARSASATYTAAWTVQESGRTSAVTLAQAPPDVLLRLGDGSTYLHEGGRSTAYACTASRCRTVALSGRLLASLARYDGAALVALLARYDSAQGVTRSGARFTFSTTSYAGLQSNCVTVSGRATSEVCIASNGVPTYWFSPGTILYLSRFSPSAPASRFVPPA